MSRFLLLLLAALAGLTYLVIQKRPDGLMDLAKDASDRAMETFLRVTSQFESEMTPTGRAEQEAWRRQRERDVRMRGGIGGVS